jgi:hypothetical protein
VLKYLDKALAAAKENQRMYCINYYDDYDGTDGLCSRLVDEIERRRGQFLHSIRIVELPESQAATTEDLKKPVPEAVRKSAEQPLFIPWENLSDIVPAERAASKPGLYLSTGLGFDRREDFFRLGVVFTVQAQGADGTWKTVFRRALERRTTGWEHWDVPLDKLQGNVKLRFTTDSYSRTQNRSWPTWQWAIWGQPQLVEVAVDGSRKVRYDFCKEIDGAKISVRLDSDGKDRPFDGKGLDSTGATFAVGVADAAGAAPKMPSIAAFTPHINGKFGVTIAEYDVVFQQ